MRAKTPDLDDEQGQEETPEEYEQRLQSRLQTGSKKLQNTMSKDCRLGRNGNWQQERIEQQQHLVAKFATAHVGNTIQHQFNCLQHLHSPMKCLSEGTHQIYGKVA